MGPDVFTATVAYERPDAYVPGSEPGAPTASWVTISEPYILIDDADPRAYPSLRRQLSGSQH